uniref:Phosphoinositide phospholipase C n=1 Tax=Saccoglossus kowalevskii TaxID=10224 RepID=A0ABM0M3I5_SACKO
MDDANANDAAVSVSEIKEIRTGKSTDTFKSSNVKKVNANHCFSLVIGNNNETTDLVALSEEEAMQWLLSLIILCTWIRDFFQKADRNGDGSLDFEEICKLLKDMNLKVDKRHVRRIFKAADTRVGTKASGESAVNELDVEEFVTFYHKITARDEIVSLFYKYSGDDDYWEVDEFLTFMQHEQKRHELHSKWCEKVILKYEQTPELIANEVMSLDAFILFMLGPNGMIMNPYHDCVYQDMTQPLSHYFIASSHNTYLLEDQLKGPSSTEAYIRALQLGCRCVELDCWDGSDGEPIIYHGHTLTSKIKFKDVIDVINRYAFEVSEYPVIVSIENHCSVEQQKKMAYFMGKIFGKNLYMRPVTPDMKALPSPEQLKHKIIIKGKKLKADASDGNVSDEDEAADLDDEEVKKQKEKKKV